VNFRSLINLFSSSGTYIEISFVSKHCMVTSLDLSDRKGCSTHLLPLKQTFSLFSCLSYLLSVMKEFHLLPTVYQVHLYCVCFVLLFYQLSKSETESRGDERTGRWAMCPVARIGKKRTWVRKGDESENIFFPSFIPTKQDVSLSSDFCSGCFSEGPKSLL